MNRRSREKRFSQNKKFLRTVSLPNTVPIVWLSAKEKRAQIVHRNVHVHIAIARIVLSNSVVECVQSNICFYHHHRHQLSWNGSTVYSVVCVNHGATP